MPRNENLSPSYWRFKSIRDPLYGFVGLTRKEVELVSSAAFQRLSYLKQLSHAYVVYPSAVHTRFEHSIGTLHVADRIAINLDLDARRRRKLRIAALLHDLGHGPFSHVFEQALKTMNGNDDFSHELVTRWILDEDHELCSILGNLRSEVSDILPPRSRQCRDTVCADIISSGIDADKLDYLRRDSYHVGASYGSFDLERILHTVDITPDGKNLCIQEKGKDAIENYRLGRYLMHAQVYEHHTRVIADQMFLRAIELAGSGTLNKNALTVRHLPPSRQSRKRFVNYYLQLTDPSVYQIIMRRTGSKAAEILSRIVERKLLKRAYEIDLALDVRDATTRMGLSSMSQEELREKERDISRAAGADDRDVIVYRSDIAVKLYGPYDILILRPNHEVRTLDEFSPISAQAAPRQRIFVFCPKEEKAEVKRAAKVELGV